MDAIHDDVAEFALLLTRLKERTDRSYAALARRLDMNASTLHRYCAGEAVPLDFTGIERFAALCGASPGNAWSCTAGGSWQSPHGNGPAHLMPGGHRRPTTPRAPRHRPHPRVTAARRTRHPSRLCQPTRARSASAADRRPHAGRPRRQPGRSIALAVSLAVALAASPHPLPDPSPVAVSRRPPPVPHRNPQRRPRTAAAARRRAGRAPHGRTAAPLTWTADSQLWQRECAHDYVIAKPPQQVPPPPTPADAAVWAASQGAVHGGTTDLRISVQGRGSAAVVLEALHVRVVNRTTPAARRGIAYSMYEGCGAILVPRYFSVNLDAHRPLARSMPGNDPDRPTPAVDFPYQVSLREPEVLLLSAHTESCTCDWYLDLDWSSQGRTGAARIDDHGRPFRTTSIKGLPHYWYRNPAGWVPMTAAYDDKAETGD
ncbi:helix-turn-helix domain-containing protein [Streptomyces kaempferi]